MDSKAQLIQIVREKSYREGEFTLASGQKSSVYVNMKATTLHPEGAYLLGKLAVEVIKSADLKVDAVGGMTLGADPIATAVSLAAREAGVTWPAFIVRKESKGHGTNEFVEGTENLKPGARLVVLEDVTTTGGTSLRAVKNLRDAGYDPVALLTVVDRENGADKKFEDEGLKFLSLVKLSELKSS